MKFESYLELLFYRTELSNRIIQQQIKFFPP